ncbi:DUF2147 domain-containing protein [Henriciella aquimarina]|uniref:DUF2147 domain-containing protein n=1 Tax=Henriciella aquimarina TaxID=545261 RepID=UPI001301EB87|nr:DUF2147 domain-containing protein [Henriciella aquimarina]
MPIRTALAAALVLIAALPALAQADSHDVFGTFFTEEGTSRVTIEDCGDGSPCGRVSWIDPDSLDDGKTPETAKTKAGEPVLGLLMLHSFEKKKRDWRGGKIYDPKEDKTYSSRLKRLEDGRLQVKGCVGPFCQTQVWREYTGG